MTQLNEFAEYFVNTYERSGIIGAYQSVINALQAQINTPQAQNLSTLSDALQSFKKSVANANFGDMPKTYYLVIEELKIQDAIGQDIYDWPHGKIQSSGVLLNEAIKPLQDDLSRLKDVFENLRSMRDTFNHFDLKRNEIKAGEAELLIILPRSLFDGDIRGFARKLQLLDQIFSAAAEIELDSVEHIELRRLSTSDPVIVGIAAPALVLFILKVVNQILDAYKKTVEIREIQARTVALDLEKETIESLARQASAIIENKINAFIDELKRDREINAEREGEFRRLALSLADLIDRGARVEGWAEPAEVEEGEANTAGLADVRTAKSIQAQANQIRSFQTKGEPVLRLAPPEEESER